MGEVSALLLVDPGALFLLVLAGSLIWYGSHRSAQLDASLSREERTMLERKGGLKLWMAAALPLCGSVVLVLLFFFFNILRWVLVPYFFLVSVAAVGFAGVNLAAWLAVRFERCRSYVSLCPGHHFCCFLPL
jgi:hypothetical protein